MKICLVGNSLSHGGADKIQAEMSLMFRDLGYEVKHVIFIDDVSYPHFGEVLNLGAIRKNSGYKDLWARFRMLKNFFKQENFDAIIDIRTRHKSIQEYFFIKWLYKSPYIATIHNAYLPWYFTPNKRIGKIIFKEAKALITVSEELKKRIESEYGYENVQVIHNPQDIDRMQSLSEEFKPDEKRYILAVGRMDKDRVKQFDKLIELFARTNLKHRQYQLVLLGDGEDRPNLEKIARNLDAAVVFKGFVDNPYPYYANADFTVLCSKYEGFPNVLCESLACGTPVIAFDCPTGPSEIIKNGVNGLLVPNNSGRYLSEAIMRMVNEYGLREKCAAQAKNSVSRYNPEIIAKKWRNLLQTLNQ